MTKVRISSAPTYCPLVDSVASSETQGQLVGPKTKSKLAGKHSLVEIFPARFDFVFGPTNCPWVSEDDSVDDLSLEKQNNCIKTLRFFSRKGLLQCIKLFFIRGAKACLMRILNC